MAGGRWKFALVMQAADRAFPIVKWLLAGGGVADLGLRNLCLRGGLSGNGSLVRTEVSMRRALTIVAIAALPHLAGSDPLPPDMTYRPLPTMPLSEVRPIDEAQKPAVMERQRAMLADRYDLADNPIPGVLMSGGLKRVQGGVRVLLPEGQSWDGLAAMDPVEADEAQKPQVMQRQRALLEAALRPRRPADAGRDDVGRAQAGAGRRARQAARGRDLGRPRRHEPGRDPRARTCCPTASSRCRTSSRRPAAGLSRAPDRRDRPRGAARPAALRRRVRPARAPDAGVPAADLPDHAPRAGRRLARAGC